MKLVKPKYSVCMPVLLNRAEHKLVVEQCIESVKKYSQNYEFTIVDDGSPLLTGFLKDAADTYIRHNPTNKGIAYSWNDAIRLARGEYIVVINDDILVERGWLLKLSNVLESGSDISAPINGWQSGMDLYKWFPGFCFMFRSSLLNEVGYFDERFFPANCEDVDYWLRAMVLGKVLGRAFDLKVFHHEGDVLHHMNYEVLSKNAIKKFIEKNGFDPIPFFYGDRPIQEAINLVKGVNNS